MLLTSDSADTGGVPPARRTADPSGADGGCAVASLALLMLTLIAIAALFVALRSDADEVFDADDDRRTTDEWIDELDGGPRTR
ncbi:hypothetical protein GCM10023222_05820 [Saccharopolyspora cebuensis]